MPDIARAEQLRVMRVIARMNVGGPALQVTGLVPGMDPGRFDHRLYIGSAGPDDADYGAPRPPRAHRIRRARRGELRPPACSRAAPGDAPRVGPVAKAARRRPRTAH